MAEEMMPDPGESKEEHVQMCRSGYEPKKPGEDYVQDPDKARTMAEAEKPFRDEKADLKKKIPPYPPKIKEPSAFSKFTGIGMAKYEQAEAERERAIDEQGKVIDEVVEEGYELDRQAKEAAEKAEKDYMPGKMTSAGLPPKPETHAEKQPERSKGTQSFRLPDKDGN